MASRPPRRLPPAANAQHHFTCDMCEKSYPRQTEYEAHLSGYDHLHRQRMADMKKQVEAAGASRSKRPRDAELRPLTGFEVKKQKSNAPNSFTKISDLKKTEKSAGFTPIQDLAKSNAPANPKTEEQVVNATDTKPVIHKSAGTPQFKGFRKVGGPDAGQPTTIASVTLDLHDKDRKVDSEVVVQSNPTVSTTQQQSLVAENAHASQSLVLDQPTNEENAAASSSPAKENPPEFVDPIAQFDDDLSLEADQRVNGRISDYYEPWAPDPSDDDETAADRAKVRETLYKELGMVRDGHWRRLHPELYRD